MKKLLILICLLIQLPVFADIEYGYNAYGDYVPMSVDGEKVRYGYNAYGDYVPMGIGDDDITYKHNSFGEYVPMSIGDDDIDYGFNAVGDFVPVSIGEDKIKYGYNAQGKYVPVSVGDTKIKYGYNAHGNYVPIKTEQKRYVTRVNYVPNSSVNIMADELKDFFASKKSVYDLSDYTVILLVDIYSFCQKYDIGKPETFNEAMSVLQMMNSTRKNKKINLENYKLK